MASNTKSSSKRIISFERARPKSRIVVVPRHVRRATVPSRQPPTSTCGANGTTPASRTSPGTHFHPVSMPSKDQPVTRYRDVGVATTLEAYNHPHMYKSDKTEELDPSSLPAAHPDAKAALFNNNSDSPKLLSSIIEQDGPATSSEASVTPGEGSFVARARASIAAAEAAAATATSASKANCDGPSDQPSKREASLDPSLLKAISKAVAREFRHLRTTAPIEKPSRQTGHSQTFSADTHETISQTRSEQKTFRRFTRDLERYARNTNAYGRYPSFTPTSQSGATLRTVSALVPYRDEFRAAGLAVTSCDQAYPRPSAAFNRPSLPEESSVARQAKQLRPLQVDGQHDRSDANDLYPVIPFPARREMDDWRYALVNEVPIEKPKRISTVSHSKSRWLPCLQRSAHSSDTGCPLTPQIEQAARSPAREGEHEKGIRPSKEAGTRQSPKSEAHKNVVEAALGEACPVAPQTKHHQGDAKITGLRRHSMVLHAEQASSMAPKTKSVLGPSTYYRKLYRHLSAAKKKKTEEENGIQIRLSKCDPNPSQTPRASHSPEKMQSPQRHVSLAKCNEHQQQPTGAQASQTSSLEQGTGSSFNPAGHRISRGHVRDPSSMPDLRRAFDNGECLAGLETYGAGDSDGMNEEKARSNVPSWPLAALENKADDPVKNTMKRDSAAFVGRSRVASATGPRPHIPKRTSSVRGSLRLLSLAQDGKKHIDDRTVLRGLSMAISAVCDTKTDLLVQEATGIHVRQVLADLAAAKDDSGVGVTGNVEEWVRQRRRDMKRRKKDVRKSRKMPKDKKHEERQAKT